ncbi:uncharacterized protein LOC132611681 [Lycium barbarum]|uniref:uncharacterized protein LOC132611681 n=1 Tax=Lycium barbarum TaxID=112863 RepID=UPI00293E2BB3|nr:uncharacterized protein LOC132611681 [Lycium barbarum]
MERNSIRFVRKCHQCQVHGDLIHSPSSELHTMSTPWPFTTWVMDVIVPIELKASNGHRFILVAIDYFTKWMEAITLKSEVCRQFKITHQNSTLYCPKANEAVEAANKNIKKILRKMVQGSRQWHKKLPFALLGYRTTVRTSVAVIPAKVEIPSLRIIEEAGIDEDERVKSHLEQLSLIDEKRLTSVEAKGKFAPNWQGPFVVKMVLPNGVLYLTNIYGKMSEIAINADAVKRNCLFGA